MEDSLNLILIFPSHVKGRVWEMVKAAPLATNIYIQGHPNSLEVPCSRQTPFLAMITALLAGSTQPAWGPPSDHASMICHNNAATEPSHTSITQRHNLVYLILYFCSPFWHGLSASAADVHSISRLAWFIDPELALIEHYQTQPARLNYYF